MISSSDLHLEGFVTVEAIEMDEENVVGVRLPLLKRASFAVREYSSLGTPAWVDQLVDSLREVAELKIEEGVRRRRLELLDEAVRKITQRVNLFDKVLIPRAKEQIDRIRIYLSDNERAAVCRSKLAKAKRQAASALAMHPGTLPPLDPDPDGAPEHHRLDGAGESTRTGDAA
jgi:V/A-type H+-transporting ATPase subunit D